MVRKIPSLLSSEKDVTDLRELGVGFIEKYNKEPYKALKKDLDWLYEDLDIFVYSDYAWPIINKNIQRLISQYTFELTEWLMEFYSFVPFWYEIKDPAVNIVDFNIFFTLARPIPTIEEIAVPFYLTIEKLDVFYQRAAREATIQHVLETPELLVKVIKGDIVPPNILNYITYGNLRSKVLQKLAKDRGFYK